MVNEPVTSVGNAPGEKSTNRYFFLMNHLATYQPLHAGQRAQSRIRREIVKT